MTRAYLTKERLIGPCSTSAPSLRRLADLILNSDFSAEELVWDGSALWVKLEEPDEGGDGPFDNEDYADYTLLLGMLQPRFLGAPAQTWRREPRWAGTLPTRDQVVACFFDADLAIHEVDPTAKMKLITGGETRRLFFYADGSVRIWDADHGISPPSHSGTCTPLYWCKQLL
jgi:hypothetical protein